MRLSALPFAPLFLLACVGDSPQVTTADGGPDTGTDSAPPGDSAVTCAAPKTSCTKGSQTVCTDTSSDDANCGQCNTVCPAGSSCKTSACACTDATKTYCKGSCTDVKTDPSNCGACGTVCPNSHCVNGGCDKIVFVTKDTYGTGVGSPGPDKLCSAVATAAGLPGKFQAWISYSNFGPAGLFTTLSKVPYVLTDGTTVAASFAALAGGTLQHAINQTEKGAPVGASALVLTNVNPDGTQSSGTDDCGNWFLDAGPNKFSYGDANSTSSTWTVSASTLTCTTTLNYHLYCFQQ